MRAPLTALLVVVAACSIDWDRLDPTLGNVGGNSAAGGAATASGGGGTGGGVTSTGGSPGVGGSPTGGNGGDGGACLGSGGDPGSLVDRGLITRYFIDEASMGVSPTELVDVAPTPLDLPTLYDGNAFTEEACHRGMRWPAISLDGGASVPVMGTKIETALDGSRTGTIECVFELLDARSDSSRISHIGVGSVPGRFTMYSDGPSSLGLAWDDQLDVFTGTDVEEWTIDLANLGRIVAHIVLDTTLPDADDRVRLYIDGVDQGVGDLEDRTIPQDARTDIIAGSDSYVLGNRASGDRSFRGTLYYCALYSEALTPAEVSQNAGVLLMSDDAP